MRPPAEPTPNVKPSAVQKPNVKRRKSANWKPIKRRQPEPKRPKRWWIDKMLVYQPPAATAKPPTQSAVALHVGVVERIA